jgi:hypothetical protein
VLFRSVALIDIDQTTMKIIIGALEIQCNSNYRKMVTELRKL